MATLTPLQSKKIGLIHQLWQDTLGSIQPDSITDLPCAWSCKAVRLMVRNRNAWLSHHCSESPGREVREKGKDFQFSSGKQAPETPFRKQRFHSGKRSWWLRETPARGRGPSQWAASGQCGLSALTPRRVPGENDLHQMQPISHRTEIQTRPGSSEVL